MKTRRVSVAMPAQLAECVAAIAMRSGVRSSDVILEAVRQFRPVLNTIATAGELRSLSDELPLLKSLG